MKGISMKNQAPDIHDGTLLLRKPKSEDAQARFSHGRVPEFVRMCGGNTSNFCPMTIEDAENWYKKICDHPLEWVVEAQGRMVGIARLTVDAEQKKARYAIGIFDPTLYGKGLGTRVTGLVLDYAFNNLKLDSVNLVVLDYNKRAIRCYEKCGFKQVCILPEEVVVDGEVAHDIQMECVRQILHL